MKRGREDGYILSLTEEIREICHEIQKLNVPWDKVSNIVDPIYNLEPPTKNVEWEFNIRFKDLYIKLSREMDSLILYLTVEYDCVDLKVIKSDIMEIKNRDFEDLHMVNDDTGEYCYIENLQKALFLLELVFVQNSKISLMWTCVTNKNGLAFSLRNCIFIQICRLRSIIYIYSGKECDERIRMGRTPNGTDFEELKSTGIIPTLKTINPNFTNESNSLWMKVISKNNSGSNVTNDANSNKSGNNFNKSSNREDTYKVQERGHEHGPPRYTFTFQSRGQRVNQNNGNNSSGSLVLHDNGNNSSNVFNGIRTKSTFDLVDELKERPKVILLYSMFDLEESFRFLLYRWKSVNYHISLEKYVNLLLTRVAMIITFNFRVENLYDKNIRSDFINLNESTTINDYCYRMTIRFYHIIEKLHRFNTFRTLINVDKNLGNDWISVHKLMVSNLKSWCTEWVNNQNSKFYMDVIRKRHLELQLPPGDDEWLSHAFPFEPVTHNSIFDKLHGSIFPIISENANMPINDILTMKHSFLSKLHDEIIIMAVDLLFTGYQNYSFSKEYYYDEAHENRLITKHYKMAYPFLAVLFSKILVHVQDLSLLDRISTNHKPIKMSKLKIYDPEDCLKFKDLILYCIIDDNTIYESISTLILILKKMNSNDSSEFVNYMYHKITTINKQ